MTDGQVALLLVGGWLANVAAAAVLRYCVTTSRSVNVALPCPRCGYSLIALPPGSQCPECGLMPTEGARVMPLAMRRNWIVAAIAFGSVTAAYLTLAAEYFTNKGGVFAYVFIGVMFGAFFVPAALLVAVHVLLPNRTSDHRWISPPAAATVAIFGGIGALVGANAALRSVSDSIDGLAGLALVVVSLPAAAGTGYAVLIIALAMWAVRGLAGCRRPSRGARAW